MTNSPILDALIEQHEADLVTLRQQATSLYAQMEDAEAAFLAAQTAYNAADQASQGEAAKVGYLKSLIVEAASTEAVAPPQ